MSIKRKVREELNKQLLNEEVDWVDVNCCPPEYYCICRATIVNNTIDNCCVNECNPEPCTTGWKDPEDDGGLVRGRGKSEPMGQTMGESRGYKSHRTRR